MSAPVSLVINLVGADRPGIVDAVSRAISDSNGNWESSRMIHLAGQFAGMVHVVLRDDDQPELEIAVEEAAKKLGLTISIVRTDTITSTETTNPPFQLEVVGQDRPGIVATISHVLAEDGANVIELATDCDNAPWSGERLFKVMATVVPPDGVDPEDLRRKIEDVAADLMVEIETGADV